MHALTIWYPTMETFVTSNQETTYYETYAGAFHYLRGVTRRYPRIYAQIDGHSVSIVPNAECTTQESRIE